jgi:hypothetical protein
LHCSGQDRGKGRHHWKVSKTAMRKMPSEIAHPEEWLASLSADAEGFSRLVRESGGVARAAYRLARARCTLLYDAPPRLEDLQAATALLNARLGGHIVLPISSLLPPPPSAFGASPQAGGRASL